MDRKPGQVTFLMNERFYEWKLFMNERIIELENEWMNGWVKDKFGAAFFLVACYATLHPMFVGPLVRWSVGPSVRRSVGP